MRSSAVAALGLAQIVAATLRACRPLKHHPICGPCYSPAAPKLTAADSPTHLLFALPAAERPPHTARRATLHPPSRQRPRLPPPRCAGHEPARQHQGAHAGVEPVLHVARTGGRALVLRLLATTRLACCLHGLFVCGGTGCHPARHRIMPYILAFAPGGGQRRHQPAAGQGPGQAHRHLHAPVWSLVSQKVVGVSNRRSLWHHKRMPFRPQGAASAHPLFAPFFVLGLRFVDELPDPFKSCLVSDMCHLLVCRHAKKGAPGIEEHKAALETLGYDYMVRCWVLMMMRLDLAGHKSAAMCAGLTLAAALHASAWPMLAPDNRHPVRSVVPPMPFSVAQRMQPLLCVLMRRRTRPSGPTPSSGRLP